MLPLLHDAPDDRARALLLLQVPDAVLMQDVDEFEDACRRARFDAGLAFIAMRRAEWQAVRGDDGLHRNAEFARFRAGFAAYACGEAGP